MKGSSNGKPSWLNRPDGQNFEKVIEQMPRIIQEYNSGRTILDLSDQYNIGSHCLGRELRKRGVIVRGSRQHYIQVCNDFTRDICDKYRMGESITHIADYYKVNRRWIENIFKDNNITKVDNIQYCSVEGCKACIYGNSLCKRHYKAEYRKINKESYNLAAREFYKRRRIENPDYWREETYGLEKGSFTKLLVQQGNKCKCCKDPISRIDAQVDHDHKTGDVRGILCKNCNWGLGNFKDNPFRLQSAIEYLADYTEGKKHAAA